LVVEDFGKELGPLCGPLELLPLREVPSLAVGNFGEDLV
jgi:hypothetical protein